MTKKKETFLTVRIDPALLIKLKIWCAHQHTNMQRVVDEVLRERLER